MSTRWIEMLTDVIKNYLGEILAALTIFIPVLCKKSWSRWKGKRKLKEELIWSPKKDHVCLIFSINGKRELLIHNVNSGKKFYLDISIAKGQTPTWSPDGSKIALVSDKDGNNEIYVVNADGSNLIRLTNDPAEDICPQWSADGKKITFFTRRNGNLKVVTIRLKRLKNHNKKKFS